MDDAIWNEAVQLARFIKQRVEELSGRSPAIAPAAAKVIDLSEHNLRVLIEHPENPKAAWDLLNEMAQHLIRLRGPFPPLLAEWTADVLNDLLLPKEQRKRPRPAKGGLPKGSRDVGIQYAVQTVAATYDVTPTRNEESEPRSACDAVADVYHLRYKDVEGIWNKRNPTMPVRNFRQMVQDDNAG